MLVVVVVVVVRTSNIGDLASLVKEIDVLGKSQVVVPHYQPGQYECTHNTYFYTTRKAFLWPSNNPLKAFNTIWQASVSFSFSWAVVSNLDPNSHWRLLSSNPISGFDLCTFVFVVVFFVLVSVFVFILVYVFVFISVIVSLWHLLPSNSLSSIGKCFSWLAQEVAPQEHEVLLLRSIQLNCQFLEVAQLVCYPTRWSLYSSLDFCVDHLSWQWRSPI